MSKILDLNDIDTVYDILKTLFSEDEYFEIIDNYDFKNKQDLVIEKLIEKNIVLIVKAPNVYHVLDDFD